MHPTQADLQAMDRAHRIGQTRPVKVFRFVCEGTVEEKIVERADRKLFLDAAVIQQGRLAEKHAQLSKDELMTMVKFGADNILHTENDKDITDQVSCPSLQATQSAMFTTCLNRERQYSKCNLLRSTRSCARTS